MRPTQPVGRLAAAALLLGAGLAACAPNPSGARFPSPDHSPERVVRFQVEALASNDDPRPDTGIAIAFRFASPANRQSTGPLERFVRIVRAPAYLPMLNHARADYGPLFERGDYAALVVSIQAADGSTHRYLFELSRQRTGSLAGCWMTDSVQQLEAAEPVAPGLSI